MAFFKPQVCSYSMEFDCILMFTVEICLSGVEYFLKKKNELNLFCSSFAGVYKGLHLSSTTPTALVHTSSSSTAGSALLQPSNITQTSSSHSALSHQVTAANSATTQVLIGNNIRLTVPSSVATVNSITTLNARHIPRTLSAVPSSALKLAAATNCQVPKVPASSSVDAVPR